MQRVTADYRLIMKTLVASMLKVALPALCLLALGTHTGCGGSSTGSGGGGGTGSTTGTGVPEVCLQSANCATDDDCASGAHCNMAISPPRCEKLYCDGVGAPCSESVTCKNGLACDGAESRCCSFEGAACNKDEDCCADDINGSWVPETCASGLCAKACLPKGNDCEVNDDCCSGLECRPDLDGFNHCEKPAQCPTCKDWIDIAGTPDSDLCPDAQTYLADMKTCGCEFCPGECTSSANCDGSFPAAIGPCKTCLQSHCGAELAACAAH
jgi:hypothetical protein